MQPQPRPTAQLRTERPRAPILFHTGARRRSVVDHRSGGGLGGRVSTRWHAGMASTACGPASIAAPVSGAANVDDSLLLAARSCVAGWEGLLCVAGGKLALASRRQRLGAKQETRAGYRRACASQAGCILLWPSATM